MNSLVKIILIALVALSVLYLLSTRGRTGHPGLEELKSWYYAHRGLHNELRPENSMAAFQAALDAGYGVELDIHLMQDGNLAVIHDCSLQRTAGVDVKITDLTTEDLPNYHLGGTEETIPTFSAVLELFAGKVPLIIELKADGNNHEALVDAAVQAMEGYGGCYCMESFDPRCVYFLKKKYPQIIRGQLTENYFSSQSSLPGIAKWVLKNQVLNFLTMPDFVAYNTRDRKTFSNTIVRRLWGVQGVTWTVRTQEDFDDAVQSGWIPIFESITP